MKYLKPTSYERKRKTYLRPVRSLRQTMPPAAKCYCVWSTANCQCLIEEITKKKELELFKTKTKRSCRNLFCFPKEKNSPKLHKTSARMQKYLDEKKRFDPD